MSKLKLCLNLTLHQDFRRADEEEPLSGLRDLLFRLRQNLNRDFRREALDLPDDDEEDGSTDDEEASTHDEETSTVDDATGGDEDPTENVENVQQGEKEKVTIYWTLEEHEFDLKLQFHYDYDLPKALNIKNLFLG